MEYDSRYWDIVWKRSQVRYNKHHQMIWDAIVPLLGGKKVVDFGCGTCIMYIGKDIDLTGIDQSPEAIAQAKVNYPKGRFFVANAKETGLPDKEFDLVVMLGLLDYFDNWEHVLVEARRVLKPGGKIFATLLNKFEGHDWTKYKHVTSNWYLYTE